MIEPGFTYCNLSSVKRFHIFIFVKEYKGRLLFFDVHTGELFLLTYKTVDKVLNTNAFHPVHKDLKLFDFIEKSPDDVFEVVLADTELKLQESEPEILDLLKCVKN